jgi:hypothetical protein
MDPSTARRAIESDVDADADAVLRQQQNQSASRESNAEYLLSSGLNISFPFAWDFNATVQSPSPIAKHASHVVSPLCTFAWDLSCNDPSPLPLRRVFKVDAPSNESKRCWEEGPWSEAMKMLQVPLQALACHASPILFVMNELLALPALSNILALTQLHRLSSNNLYRSHRLHICNQRERWRGVSACARGCCVF